MNKQKLVDTNLYFGIDTIQVKSETESVLTKNEVPYISKNITKDSETGSYFYKLNPDKANGNVAVFSYSEYDELCNFMIEELMLTNPVKTRIDYRVDSYDNNFDELLKLNKLLILLIAERFNISNRYQSVDLLTQRDLCVRIQNTRLEVENYNKAVEEPNGDVMNRIEFRSKKLYDNTENKEYTEYKQWCRRLDLAVTKANFNHLQEEINSELEQRYKEQCCQRGFSVNEFLYKYQNSIFTSRQMSDLYKRLGYKDPVQQAKKYKQRKHIEYFSFKDVQMYVEKIKASAERFFDIHS